jgi:tRNA U34 5-methylaminomethyl-2-thiouridine-forming methyltransferase MnmC
LPQKSDFIALNKNLNSSPQLTHFLTADGSSSLKLNDLDEQYHSVNGAIQESSIVYIQNGLLHIKSKNIKLLEVGFGTGLNCLLSFHSNLLNKNPSFIEYTAIEPFPIPNELIEKLNYPKMLGTEIMPAVFKKMHLSKEDEKNIITPHFSLTRSRSTVQTYQRKEASFDLIYFDAFGPNIQPEMWTVEIFKKMYALLKEDGILVTYCAKGEVKRILKSVGFKVENLPGPPGKREVTRAVK